MFRLSVSYLPDSKIIRIMTFGSYDRDANKQVVAAGLAAKEEHGTDRFLVDHRNVDLAFDIMNLSDIPKINERLGVQPGYWLALLHRADRNVVEKFQYLEDLSYIQGMRRRVFTDEQAAIDWLSGRGLDPLD